MIMPLGEVLNTIGGYGFHIYDDAMPEILGVAHDALYISGESVGGLGVCFCVLAKEDVVTVSRALELAIHGCQAGRWRH
jgi:hypothetical protein